MRLLFDSSEQLLKQTLHAIIRDHRFALFLDASKVFDRFIYSLLFGKLLRKKNYYQTVFFCYAHRKMNHQQYQMPYERNKIHDQPHQVFHCRHPVCL